MAMKKLIPLILLLLLMPVLAWPACTGGGTSCTKSGTIYTCTSAAQGCIADVFSGTGVAAAEAGDTVNFPSSGSSTWTTAVTIGVPVTIVGNGTTLTGSGALLHGFFFISGITSDALLRITGFNFVNSGTTQSYAIQVSETTATLGQLRIDNNTFREGNYQLEVAGSFGVVDKNIFYNSCNVSFSFTGGTRATSSWTDLSAGTANALFVENNQWIFEATTGCSGLGIPVDTFNGGKLVFRYNTIDTTANSIDSAIWMFMTHGSAAGGVANGYWAQGTGARRGQSVVEVYNNYVNATGKPLGRMVCLRGGANLVHHNSLVGTGSADIYLREEEYYEVQWNPLRTAWPAEDQVHNSFFWANTSNGTPMESTSFLNNDNFNTLCTGNTAPFACCTGSGTGTCNSTEANGLIKLNRDFFLHAPCGASDSTDAFGNTCTHGIETFTGDNGASGTNPTDGDPYPNLGTMEFTATGNNAYYGYTPYTCPHPLTGLTGKSCNALVAGTSGYGVDAVQFGGITGVGVVIK
jgi:hypothetical protein